MLRARAPLTALLIAPDRFPGRYPASVLRPAAVDRALHDIDGTAPGSTVDPATCVPPAPGPAPRYAVAAAGTDIKTDATITVTVIRATGPLAVRRAQLAGCPLFTSDARGTRWTVTSRLLAPPPVNADDSYAVTQTATSSAGAVRSSLTLAAQVADLRVGATWMSPHRTGPGVSPDVETLDGLFAEAVSRIRH